MCIRDRLYGVDADGDGYPDSMSDYRIEYRWHTSSDSASYNWEDVNASNFQFEFEVPVTEWDCYVDVYVYIQNQNFRDSYNHMTSRSHYFQTDCSDPGNVSLDMDGLGEAWEDWSNLVNGTNEMSWRLDDLIIGTTYTCLLYTSPSPRDRTRSRMPSSA